MNIVALITGYLVILAATLCVITYCVVEITMRIHGARDAEASKQIDATLQRLAHHIYDAAWWFSEDMPTTLLMQEIAANVRRGVAVNPNQLRDEWWRNREKSAFSGFANPAGMWICPTCKDSKCGDEVKP